MSKTSANECAVINVTAIKKRIEELRKEEVLDEQDDTRIFAKINELKLILSQSTPLIPEIEKAFDAGSERGEHGYGNANDKQEYISNLKIDI
jgi:hypothetical protein